MEVELEGLKVRLRRTDKRCIAAEHRRLAYDAALIGFGRPRDPARRVADAEWRPVEAAARRALEEEDEWRRVQEAGQRVLEEENLNGLPQGRGPSNRRWSPARRVRK
jgi:hypothetical protein